MNLVSRFAALASSSTSYFRCCSYQLLLSNQDKGSTPSLAQCLALPYGPSLHNLTNNYVDSGKQL